MYRYLNKIIVLSLFFALFVTCTFAYEEGEEELNITDAEWLKVSAEYETQPKILSKVALAYDVTYQKILYEKNIFEKVSNASTTKILTAIVAYENSNLEDMVLVSKRAAAIGGSRVGLISGEKISMQDLLKGLMLSSGNDAAIAIAEHVGGSVEKFCEMMNEKAKILGATSTHFTSPHGLDNDNHYTTANDLLIFTKYLLDIDYLAKLVDQKEATIKIGERVKNIRTTNEMHSIYDDVTGVKTGFTNKAGRCLITSLKRNDRELIIIVLGADTKKQRTLETIQLINYGINNFEKVDLYAEMKKEFPITVEKSKEKRFEISISGEKFDLLKKSEKDKIRYEYRVSNKLIAPVSEGQKLGEISIYLDDELLNIVNLTAAYPIERKNIDEYFEEILKNKLKYIEFMQ